MALVALAAAPTALDAKDASAKAKATAAGEATVNRKSAEPVPRPRLAWTEAEQAAALKSCLVSLSKIRAEVTGVEPVRKNACGSPAMVEVAALSTPAGTVRFRPAVKLNCPMVPALVTWLTKSVQPAAQRHLGAPVTQLRGVGGYACRNRNGAKTGRLSEHAFGNALDVATFVVDGRRRVSVLKGWGLTKRDFVKRAEPAPAVEPVSRAKPGATTRPGPIAKPARRPVKKADRPGPLLKRVAATSVPSAVVSTAQVEPQMPPLPMSRDEGLGLVVPLRNPERVSEARFARDASAQRVRVIKASLAPNVRYVIAAPADGTAKPSASRAVTATEPATSERRLSRRERRRLRRLERRRLREKRRAERARRRAEARQRRAEARAQRAAERAAQKQRTTERTAKRDAESAARAAAAKSAQRRPSLRASSPGQRARVSPAALAAAASKPEALFLREIHRGACKTFGTVLGPEANEAHRDHFHLDLAARRRSNYCR